MARAFRSTTFLAGAAIASCVLASAEAEVLSASVPTLVARAYLRPIGPALLLADDQMRCSERSVEFAELRYLPAADRVRMVSDFARAEPTAYDFEQLCKPTECRLIEMQELQPLMAEGDQDPSSYWNRRRERFGERTLVTLGSVVVEGDRAISCYCANRGLLSGWCSVVFLRLEKGEWIVVEDTQILIE